MSATPLVAGHAPTSILTWIDNRPLSAAQFCGAARASANAMPPARHALNLCEDGAWFMLASAAAWLRGQTIVLPPDRLERALLRLRQDFADAYCMCDGVDSERTARACGFDVVRADRLLEAHEAWPPPELPDDFVAACLHTSGSTGEPTRHRKLWGELVGGARTMNEALGMPPADVGVIGTVAPQHMFGFETTIMFPLQCGVKMLPVRPSLPADVADAMSAARSLGVRIAWLFTTPLQLRAFHAASRVDGVVRVVTATMPLDVDLARRVERDWQARVDEIYGCTEGGTLAFRRPTVEDAFSAGQGIVFEMDEGGRVAALCAHLSERVPLADRIELVDPSTPTTSRRIRLQGRSGDLVKVAGKRASLAGLTATLRSVPGVLDGAFFFPSDDAKRLCAVAVAPAATPAAIQRALAAAVDPAFLPRPLVLVEAIPRSASQKVPISLLRELVAAHTRGRAEESVLSFAVRFDGGDSVFAGHFPWRPIVPAVLLVERVEAALAARGRRIVELRSAKFHATAAPGESLDFRIDCASEGVARFEVRRDSTLVASGACRLEPSRGA